MRMFIRCCLAVIVALPVLADAPSFDLGDEGQSQKKTTSDRTLVISSVDDLPLQAITGHGARNVKRVVEQVVKLNPKTEKFRLRVGQNTEGSVRWTYWYPKSVTPLDEKKRPHGTQWLAIHLTMSTGRIVNYRLIPWKHGVRDGVEKEFHRDKLTAEVPWCQDKMHGLRKVFFPNSKIRSETHYVDGLAHGTARVWDREGNLISECTMKEGKRQGKLIEYWPGTDQPQRIITYKDGVTHGVVREFYRSGKLKRERTYRKEAAHGEDRIFNEEGKVVNRRYWYDGDPVTKEEFEQRSKAEKEEQGDKTEDERK